MNKITYEERAKVYDKAKGMFGTAHQLIVAVEEMSEIQKEICKALRGEVNLPNLAEEVADATIMLEQIRLLFDINDEVGGIMDAKVERLRQNIQKTKTKNQACAHLRRSFLEKPINLPVAPNVEE